MPGFAAKENPLYGVGAPFCGMVISNTTASPPLMTLSGSRLRVVRPQHS
jgi:hypothetical protein